MIEIATIKSKFMKNIFDHNTYVLLSKKNAIIIDAGAEIEDVKSVVGNRKVLAVLFTHLHFDHTWNIEDYVSEFGCDVYVAENQENRFADVDLNASYMVRQNIIKNVDKKFIKYYAEKLKIGEFNFDIILTPGHTADGVCILCDGNLFTGDTVFADGVGRTDLKDSNPFELKESLEKISKLKFETAFPGHYEPANKEKILKNIFYYI